ncbi:MAG: aminotransferase class I/II-fold pyridoxal phosphate-dependent enzyme [Bdellovibrionales bacterium]|nr:aminotransferase class I/II-fold pyridoxal phosphate-dependent enzyme [Bdellovibrionales bacterium]
MFKQSFGSDNHSGIHPEILKALIEVNQSHSASYGTDELSREFEDKLSKTLGTSLKSFFVFNGTAANVLAIKPFVKSYESILCSDIAHLHVDECAAPEMFIGSKLQLLPSENGKIKAQDIKTHIQRLGDQHAVQPRLVSITQPTEVGTIYSLEELKEIKNTCSEHNLFLHIDGARFVLNEKAMNCSLKTLIQTAQPDSLSFGGGKNGLMLGEAVVFFNTEYAKDFKYIRKQAMQLPSKTRFFAAQFIKLLDVYNEIAEHEIKLAKLLEEKIKNLKNTEIAFPVQTNVVFLKFPKAWTKTLKQCRFFYMWDTGEWIARIMMSFDSTEEDVLEFYKTLKHLDENH